MSKNNPKIFRQQMLTRSKKQQTPANRASSLIIICTSSSCTSHGTPPNMADMMNNQGNDEKSRNDEDGYGNDGPDG